MMHVTSGLATPVAGEKRSKPAKKEPPPGPEPRKVSSFIQRFYLFGTNAGSPEVPEGTGESPKVKKAKVGDHQPIDARRDSKPPNRSSSVESNGSVPSTPEPSSKEPSPVQYPSYSVQRLRQFWNNRLLSGSGSQQTSATAAGSSVDTLVRKTKSATIAAPTGVATRAALRKSPSPKAVSRFHRNGSIGRSGKRRLTLDDLDSCVRVSQDLPLRRQSQPTGEGVGTQKRTSHAALLSPDRESVQQLVEKRPCIGTVGLGPVGAVTAGSAVPTVRDSFPLAISTPTGGQIHWARRTELLGIRALTQDEKRQRMKMPLRVENYVNSFIDVDIQSVTGQDASMEAGSKEQSQSPHADTPASCDASSRTSNTSSLRRKVNTPTRKISFLNNISPYNRKLLACNGTKVAALTNKFNQMIQQDASLLEQVKKRGGYLQKCGNVAYKVLEDPGCDSGYGFTTASRKSGARGSLRKKNSNASATSGNGGNRTDESSDEISSVSSKNSSIRKVGVRKRPSLRKNIYRRPEWETGRSSLGVRKVLELFEPNVQHNGGVRGRRAENGSASTGHGDTGKPPPGRSKPKVPDKSEHVLKKTKDIKSKKVRPALNDVGEASDACDIGARDEPEGSTPAIVESTDDSVPDGPTQEFSDKELSNVAPESVSKEEPIVSTIVAANDQQEQVVPPKDVKEKKKSKSTVSKIYERLTFRSSKKIPTEVSVASEAPQEIVIVRDEASTRKPSTGSTRRSFVSSIEIPAIQIDDMPVPQPIALPAETPSDKDTSEQKILEALSAVNQRIDNLSKSVCDLTLSNSKSAILPNITQTTSIQPVLPNSSFLFRDGGSRRGPGMEAANRHASQRNIVEAVNTVVINKSISMDDHHFPCSRSSASRLSLNERSLTQRGQEDGYELVTRPDESRMLPDLESISSTSLAATIDLTELTSKIESFVHKSKREADNIYQSIPQKVVASNKNHLVPEDTVSINSYESFENYESIEHEARSDTLRAFELEASAREEDTYEICSPPPELPPAREDSRNDLTLPQPKRNLSSSPKTLPKHLQVTYQSNYERIKYSKIPPRPPKPEEVPLPPRNNSAASIPAGGTSPLNVTLDSISSTEFPPSPGADLLDKSAHRPEGGLPENIYEENIYDTIRSADGVDYDDPATGGSSAELEPNHAETSLQNRRTYERPPEGHGQQPSPPADSVSLVSSNCYESIGSRLEFVRQLALNRRSMGGSTTTLASDHITNSLYGTTVGLASLTPPSERGSDTSNSADWTDISDEDDGGRGDGMGSGGITGSKRPNFIVVRERKRTHHTPLRSRKLARIAHPRIDDDSDHHYESLYSVGSNEGKQVEHPEQHTNGAISNPAGANFHEHRGDPSGTLLSNDDEFDSFDSDDTEDEFEDEDDERNRARTDSGVDIRNAKLPDPPPSNSQVYVLVQKIKSLGTLSKSEIAKGFHKLSKKKPTKGSATYENAPALPSKPSSKTGSKASSKPFKLQLPLVGGGGGLVPKPPPEDYEDAPLPGTHPALPGSASLLLASSPSLSSVSASNPCVLISSPTAEQQPSAGVRSTSESSNVSSNVLRPYGTVTEEVATRKKSKTTKSLRSKLRKSLVSDTANLNIGSSFNGSRSTFYVTSADVDSGIFNGSEGCLNPPIASSTLLEASPVKASEDNRRKSLASTGGVSLRPTIPPPPPPAEAGKKPHVMGSALSPLLAGGKSASRKLGATSWYAECGVFKQSHSFGTGSDQSLTGIKGGNVSPQCSLPAKDGGSAGDRTTASNGLMATSWYADIYQTSGASVASSSESSGVSTGGEGGPGDDHSHSMFVNEPLYQIYNAAKLESITRDIDAEISGRSEAELYDDGYEKIAERNRRRTADGDEGGSTSCGSSSTEGDDRSDRSSMHLRKPSRPTALELIEPNVGKLRTLWCEVPEVRNSEILATLTPTEKRLQEAKFEILTSEASYLKSLNLLRTHFVNHPAFRDTRILSSSERKTLFSSIIPVQECSDRLLCDLENCWQDNIMLLGLSHSIYKHAEKHFHVYVSYCEHQAKIDRTLKALKANKPEFARTLAALEADPVCCSLSLSSFLMLPMQRITRMRLLLDAVLQRCQPEDDDEFGSWESTFVLINRILTQCNDAAHRSEQLYEMELLSRQIEFPTAVRPLPIVPCGIGAAPSTMHRKLEKRGELVHVLWRGDDAKLTFGKKFSKSNVYAFLFTDLLVLTKKKSDESYLVIDYCQRALLTVSSGDVVPGLPAKEMQTIGKNLIIMTLLENHEGKTIEMILSCPSETERERWLMVTEPPASENPDEKIYEQWDCPQVIAVHPYEALQPDELDLDIKDVVNVHRKMADGWYEGERIRDGAVGWFPSNYTKEIPSAHIRAKHIKQRHLLLTYTSKYIDTATKAHQHLHQQQQQQQQQHQQQQQQHQHHQQQLSGGHAVGSASSAATAAIYATSAPLHELYNSQHDSATAGQQQQADQQQQQQQQSGASSSSNGAPTYTELSNHNPNRGLSAYGNPQYPVSTSTHGYTASTSTSYNSAAKPYRPWGAEMAC
ncbi:uncharacterized protein LOC128724567 [Anopheles nili]|uniref:uncharacterized protein LOC128724567 n=1 Tax=Anopheles nili TaxID=185578 RepID=UPI00237C0B2A|nr:uncharacterized protein LOC128724567 [Anopheles nili]